jgi:hypothetical protein
VVLHRLLLREGRAALAGRALLEVGAGAGLPGLTAAACGAPANQRSSFPGSDVV